MKSVVTTILAVLASFPAAAFVPDVVTYAGTLKENGTPANGTYTVVIEAFDAAEGGSRMFTQSDASVAVIEGDFIVDLGSDPTNPFDAELLDGPLFLSVTVNGEELTPRVALSSVPYAKRAVVAEDAETLEGMTPEDIAELADITKAGAGLVRNGNEFSLAFGGVTSSFIAFGAVTSDKLASGAVGSSALATDSVDSRSISAGAVGSSELGIGSIEAVNIGAGAVTANAILGGAVTNDKLNFDAVDSRVIAEGAVGSSELVDGAVRSADIGSGEVKNGNLALDSVDGRVIKEHSIGSSELADHAIGASHIVSNAIAAAHIQGGVIAPSHLRAKTDIFVVTNANCASGAGTLTLDATCTGTTLAPVQGLASNCTVVSTSLNLANIRCSNTLLGSLVK